MSTRREWWVDPVASGPARDGIFDGYPNAKYDDLVHVREVLPDSREFTRKELFDWCKANFTEDFSTEVEINWALDELWPE